MLVLTSILILLVITLFFSFIRFAYLAVASTTPVTRLGRAYHGEMTGRPLSKTLASANTNSQHSSEPRRDNASLPAMRDCQRSLVMHR
jgi:hypothetical protein